MDRAAGQDGRVERRIVTVLFADLVGFTPLSERLDAEDVGTIQDAYFATVAETIGRYGGQLEKFIGDAAMAVFGLPRTRDDDAERAVRAGLALVNAVEALAGRIGLETGDLRLRVGINTGEVVTSEAPSSVAAAAGPSEGRVTGDPVNTAARLQTAAPPGRVLIGEATALAVAEAIELEAGEPILLKGKAAPTRASLALAVRPIRSRELAMGRLQAPLIGRTEELSRLREIEARLLSGGAERVILVAPPGVGKTRLIQEFLGHLAGVHVLRGRLRADARSPFEPIVQLLSGALEGDPGDPPDPAALLERLGRAGVPVARARVVVDDVLSLVSPTSTTTRRADRDALFDAWATMLDTFAPDLPVVWFIEDLHWAEPDLLRFIDAANDRPRPGGRLILATGRPSILERLRAEGPTRAGTSWPLFELATLGPSRAAELISALIGPALPDRLVARIVEASDGNPLFIEELLRTWVSVGILVPGRTETDAWRLAVPATDVPLPATVQAIYAAQLDDLPAQGRTAARRAAVAGRRFPTAALDALGVPDVLGSLAILARRALIAGPEDDPITGVGYVYRHALLRDAGYASLAKAERARLHVRLAHWLESAAGDRVLEVAELIGSQFEAALENTPALAVEVGDGLDRPATALLAAHWLERAGDLARARFANEAARTLYARSVALTASDGGIDLGRRWSRLGEAIARVADLDEAAVAFGRATDHYRAVLADETTPQATRTVARRGLGGAAAAHADVRYEQMRFSEARAIAEAGLELTGRDDPYAAIPLLIARINGLEGLTNDYLGLYAESLQVVGIAQATSDPDLTFDARRVALGLGHAAGVTTPADWLGFATEAEHLGRWETTVGAMVNAAGLLTAIDRPRVRTLTDQAQAIAQARGLTERLAWINQARCELELESGDWALAREEGVRALDLGDAKGYDRAAVRTWFALTPIAAACADGDLLSRAATWFTRRAGAFPTSPYGNVMRAAVDLRLAAAGLGEAPELDLATLLEGFELAENSASWVASIERIVEGWLERGDINVAVEAVQRYCAVELGSESPIVMASRTLVTATLAPRGGPGDPGVTARDAVAGARTADAPWWISRSLRLLQAAGAATTEHVSEADRLEAALGIVVQGRQSPR